LEQRIERVDTVPLIIHWLMQMKVHEVIDRIYLPHSNWEGLSYGQLALLFITYVIHRLTHRLSGMEEWLHSHKTVIEQVTGWKLGDKEATDDRLGRMIEVFGEEEGKEIDYLSKPWALWILLASRWSVRPWVGAKPMTLVMYRRGVGWPGL
jgi:hypothetical protein